MMLLRLPHFISILSSTVFMAVNLVSFPVNAEEDLEPQKFVPAILFSHRLTPGMLKYSQNYKPNMILPANSFELIVEEFVQNCESNTYVFINHAGIRTTDLDEYSSDLTFLKRYTRQSSTKLKFERVNLLPMNTFDNLVNYTMQHCGIEKHITLTTKETDEFQAYIDTDKRVISIDYSPMTYEEDERREEIAAFDQYLRTILAQIPSPYISVIYSSLEPDLVPSYSNKKVVEIFPEIFQDMVEEKEVNDRLRMVPPPTNEYRPKFKGMSTERLTLFDAKFIQENNQLLRMILTTFVGYLILQVFLLFQGSKKKGSKENRGRADNVKAVKKTDAKGDVKSENNNESGEGQAAEPHSEDSTPSEINAEGSEVSTSSSSSEDTEEKGVTKRKAKHKNEES